MQQVALMLPDRPSDSALKFEQQQEITSYRQGNSLLIDFAELC